MKKTILALLILTCSCHSSNHFYNKGTRLAKLGLNKASLKAFNKSISLDSNNTMAYNNRGYLYAEKNHDYKAALADFNKVIKLKPDYDHAYYNRAFAHSDLEMHQETIDDIDKAIALNPKNEFDLLLTRAYHKRKIGDIEGEIEDYTKILKYNPKYSQVYTNRAISYEEIGDTTKAIIDYKTAIQLNKLDTVSLYNLGMYYLEHDSIKEGCYCFKQAISAGDKEAGKVYNTFCKDNNH